MRGRDYDAVVSAIAAYKGDDAVQHVIVTFPRLDTAELSCIVGQEQQKRVKRSYRHYTQQSTAKRIYKKYQAAAARNEGPGILLELARYYNFSPAMLARLVLEQYLDQNNQQLENNVCSSASDRLSPPSMLSQDSLVSDDRGINPVTPDDPNSDPISEDTSEPSSEPTLTEQTLVATLSAEQTALPSNSDPISEPSSEPTLLVGLTADQTALPSSREKTIPITFGSEVLDMPSDMSSGRLTDNATGVSSRGVDDVASNTTSTETPTLPTVNRKTRLNKLYRDTSLIADKTLSLEVQMCLVNDDVYGPFADTIKHSIGHEYEVLLCRKLEECGIGYQTEDDLRVQGCDKTPDIKLDVPIGVGGRVVNWIESKASFGDRENHRGYLKDQFWSYWNRFGPGLVIYWFGFIDDLNSLSDKGIVIRDHFPEDITKLDPLALVED